MKIYVKKDLFKKIKNKEMRCFTIENCKTPSVLEFFSQKTKRKLGYCEEGDFEVYSFYQIEEMENMIFHTDGMDYEDAQNLMAIKKEYFDNIFCAFINKTGIRTWRENHFICLIKNIKLVKLENHVYYNLLNYYNKKKNEEKQQEGI